MEAPCSTLNHLYIDDVLIHNYEAVVSDDCTNAETNKTGTTSICCLKNSVSALHVSFTAAEKGEFPHHAKVNGCGGTIYNKDWVITAAHCVVGDDGFVQNVTEDPFNVIIGTNLGEISSDKNTFAAKSIIVANYSLLEDHPEVGGRYYNDIALVQLNRSIDFASLKNVKALKIAAEKFRPEDYGDTVVGVGWGASELSSYTSEHLQKTNLAIRNDTTCFDKKKGPLGQFQYDVLEFADQLICVGGYVGKSAGNVAGRGDSGGPAVCRNKDGYAVLCGVTSFGSEATEEECDKHRNAYYCEPSVYVDVGYFHDWIQENAGKQDPETLYKVKLYGSDVPNDKYMHQVHVTTKDGQKCGGTLVSQDTVVTAGHCVVTDDKKERPGIVVEAMVRNLSDKRSENKYLAKYVRYGPNFARYAKLDKLNITKSNKVVFRDSPYTDNIALIKLERKVNIGLEQLPRLPTNANYSPGPAVEVAFPLRLKYSGTLRERNFTIFSEEECQRRLDRLSVLNVSTEFDGGRIMCGVETYSGGSTCDRELGGGLICQDDHGREVFCGVQTFRFCEFSLPNAFLYTGKYVERIKNVINDSK